jgi:hypothetical protein
VGSGDVYRRYATECLLLAEQVDDPDRKAVLISMAAAWHKLAEFADGAAIIVMPPEDGDRS